MANKEEKKSLAAKDVLVKLKFMGRRIAYVLASRAVRALVILAALGMIVWQVRVKVWDPLKQDFNLPPGISPQNPQIDEVTLLKLNSDRAERAAYKPTSKSILDRQFAQVEVKNK